MNEKLKKVIDYFNGDELAANVWLDKYCLKDRNGNHLEETPDDMHKRLAKEFARIELKYPNPMSYEEIYFLLRNFRYILPGGSILYGLGNSFSYSTLGNCFVIGNNSDSYGGILSLDEEQAQLMKRRKHRCAS
jgi:ribonucleoside-diphosphate reductase alpha chain